MEGYLGKIPTQKSSTKHLTDIPDNILDVLNNIRTYRTYAGIGVAERATMTAPRLCSTPPRVWPGPITSCQVEEVNAGQQGRNRKCGCLRTSEKLKKILGTFPVPPPPTPMAGSKFDKASGFNYGHSEKQYNMAISPDCCNGANKFKTHDQRKTWRIVAELVTLVQLSVTATALALYYLIYCYMQLVYYTLRSALFFHNADGPMKITIGVVTVTSLIVGFNILLRMERIIGIVY